MATDGATFAEVAQKTDQEIAEIEAQEKALRAVEAHLIIAEKKFQAAEARYNVVARKVAEEAAKPLEEPAAPAQVVEKEVEPDDDVAAAAEAHATEMHHKGTKNAGALSDKVVSSERWLAKRAQEHRVREAAKRGREVIRRRQRDSKAFFNEPMGEEVGSAPAPAAPEPAEPAPATEPEATKIKDLIPLETASAKEGAQGIADRLKSLTGDDEQKRNALGKILTGGRDCYYTFESKEVIAYLKDQGLIDDALAASCQGIIDAAAPKKGESLPPSEWLAHAKKLAAQPDAKPFTEAEHTFLQAMEDKSLLDAELELAAAEAFFEEVLAKAGEMKISETDDYADILAKPMPVSGEVVVDEDLAAQVEAHYEATRESRGAKNTSTLTDKQASCKKWEHNHKLEAREREHEKKARDARRQEARDWKTGDER
mmetsp:Transcript_13485/g.29756  ORF Transcript_13485/g.29756 Transcript_13485/m.29756 type:complete len:427 (+) Transcript_13485:283-1563(+)|eukprot:CAMPEP_0194752092 /NCGR_PEP_ID=MMETSP0323_2-20130528/5938_1 /TAXON_ID=2866 ORGANISM="Crypthecodinium cohnii, Strain Seligo" /NCGR_SAMPLE_ID=MMETSP0323_2 /ASSEMBLY_ACC=CAM_ASM_000346 /LENGTH=426 /DNA_ID=CAMNT_0039668819 /DNA_START=172 /DNA_END=1452 /DNA_ORIENTATION=-